MRRLRLLACVALLAAVGLAAPAADDAKPYVVYDGSDGPGKGKHIVLISGDEEYRSEEALPQLGKILAKHHGFKCTVLFAIDPKDGTINPNHLTNIPGLEALKTADLAILFLRYRDLPDEQMKHLEAYLDAGKPVIGIRTTTHAFRVKGDKPYGKWDLSTKGGDWDGGFGRRVLGETWISHHGAHKKESTRGVIAKGQEKHPIARGLKDGDLWGPTDVYGVRLPLPGDSTPVILGQVLAGMKPDDKPVEGKKNEPMMPIVWTKTYKLGGKEGKAVASTIGASEDLASEGVRRMFVNASYWLLGMEDKLPERAKVDLVGEYKPSPYATGGFKKGVKPADLAMPK